MIDKAKLIEGWMSDSELKKLAELARDAKNILEVGSFRGRSTRALADNTSGTVTCVDIWDSFATPYPDAVTGAYKREGDGVYNEFQLNLSDHIESGKVIAHRMPFSYYNTNKRYDLIFIDANHSYDSVKHDIRKALSLLSPNGIIAGHDYCQAFTGVIRAVDEVLGIKKLHATIWYKQIKETPMSDTRVMICIPTAEYGRRADFYDYVDALERPAGSMQTKAHSQSPARGRNIMIRQAIAQNATHVLFIDDDVLFSPDALLKLLAHDKDIVSGLYLHRNYPHLPLVYQREMPGGACLTRFLQKGDSGLQEIVNAGLGFVLIKIEVFKTMLGNNDPEKFCWITLGELDKDHWGDDISFFNRARKAGFKMYVDLDVPCGHVVTAIIFPNRMPDGTWHTLYNTNADNNFQVPQMTPTEEEIQENIVESLARG